MATVLSNGEVVDIPRLHPLPEQSTQLGNLPPAFVEIMNSLWVRGTPKRFFQGGPKLRDCWVYEGTTSTRTGSPSGYPRISRHGRKNFSLRRYVAEIFWDLDSVDFKVYVQMKCGHQECVNPNHFGFTTGPAVRVSVD